jgi:hypothetical protein
MRAHYRTIIENLCQDSIAHMQRIRQMRSEIDTLRLQAATLEGMVGGLAERVIKLELHRYPCCEHCPTLHREGLLAWLGHNYPCRDINCPGYLSIEEGGK